MRHAPAGQGPRLQPEGCSGLTRGGGDGCDRRRGTGIEQALHRFGENGRDGNGVLVEAGLVEVTIVLEKDLGARRARHSTRR